MISRTFLFGSIINSERTVRVSLALGWIRSYNWDTLRSASAMMGKVTWVFWVSLISSIQRWWDSTGSTLRASTLTPRLANSSLSLAVKPNSVVHTGVKSAGWENRMPQESPSHSWKWIGPSEESWVKSGARSPSRSVISGAPSISKNGVTPKKKAKRLNSFRWKHHPRVESCSGQVFEAEPGCRTRFHGG